MSRLLLALGLALLMSIPALAADEDVARADASDAATSSPAMRLAYLDLLPLGEFERQDFRAANLDLARRLERGARKLREHRQRLAKLDRKDADGRKRLAAGLAAIQKDTAAGLAELRDLLRPHGLTDAMLETMAVAPAGEGRIERYSHQLVLLLEDLAPDQRAIFERAIPQVDGAYLTAKALTDRTTLALKQADLEERQKKAVLDGFRRQTRVIESRFWRLVDYVLEDEQKARLWEMLPSTIRRHASPEDHVYALPNLRPTQGARVKALITEVQAEGAPDEALTRRLRKTSRDKTISREERKAQAATMREAQARLNKLRRFAYDAVVELLDEDQVLLLKAIPPRVSANDRRADARRVLDGMSFSADQEAALKTLRREGKEAAKAYRQRMSEVRKEQGEVGPDSPQMMMMEMMMASARGEAQTAQRHLLGRIFREVLTPDQVSGWVMGLYGYRR